MARHEDEDTERDESRSEDEQQEARDRSSEDEQDEARDQSSDDDQQEARDRGSDDDQESDDQEPRGEGSEREAQEEPSDRSPRSAASDGRGHVSALAALKTAKQQLTELIGHPTESVSASTKTDDGWDVTVEVVELERIPSSTDVLASYRASLDGDGNVMDYQRTRRYYRNRADEGE